jgi:site-specific DNA-methyltransferase (adenine-specific)
MTKNTIEPIEKDFDTIVKSVADYSPKTRSVFSDKRDLVTPTFIEVKGLKLNKRQKMDGLKMLKMLDDSTIPLVFFDPQYRTILDKQSYGNEGKGRGKERSELPQMDEKMIKDFLKEIERVLTPSGHLMLWVDKYIVCSGINALMEGRSLQLVDLITWNKGRMGMGYRTRRYSEYLVIFQKLPVRAKGVWRVHDIPDVWDEKIIDKNHTHSKPVELQKRLIKAVTNIGDVVLDPSAGGFSVLKASQEMDRNFLGCDILG